MARKAKRPQKMMTDARHFGKLLAMSVEQRDSVLCAIMRYFQSGTEPANLDPYAQAVFDYMRDDIDEDMGAYADKCEQNARNARSRDVAGDRTPDSCANAPVAASDSTGSERASGRACADPARPEPKDTDAANGSARTSTDNAQRPGAVAANASDGSERSDWERSQRTQATAANAATGANTIQDNAMQYKTTHPNGCEGGTPLAPLAPAAPSPAPVPAPDAPSSAPERQAAARKTKPRAAPFVPPAQDEVRAYWTEQGFAWSDPDAFFDYYTANGWKAGKNPMRDWRATARNWERREARDRGGNGGAAHGRERATEARERGIRADCGTISLSPADRRLLGLDDDG